MKIQTIEYEELFPTGVYANQRYRAIGTLEDGDDFGTCFKELKDKVEETFVKLNPQIQWSQPMFHPPTSSDDFGEFSFDKKTGTVTLPPTKDERIQSFIATINMCTNLKFLKNFEGRVIAENNPELTNAYTNKLKSFE